jgi:DNA polymerase-1
MKKIWLVDFEFTAPLGNRPRPICMVAQTFPSGETKRVWLWDDPPAECPIPMGADFVYVAYLASAELGCHLALQWELPVHVVDVYAEFRNLTSGLVMPGGNSLLGALQWFGLGGISSVEKSAMRELAMRGGPYSAEEKGALLEYCESDVVALAQLLPRMIPRLNLPHALVRGRYVKAVAHVEWTGIPIDVPTLDAITSSWPDIKRHLIAEVDRNYGVYDGATFKLDRWASWCTEKGITWPRLPSGALDLKRDTFREMGRLRPEVNPMHELRSTLSELRLNNLAVGPDGHNRYLVGVFGAKTGRNTPSSAKAVFGPSRWIRHLIKPNEGMALAYVDWSQQELGIAAKLSGDPAMQNVYRESDPYIAFAKLARAVPADATKQSHPSERANYKVCALAVLMGMGPDALGAATGTCEAMGRRLLRQHKELFPRFWRWSDNQVDRAMLGEVLSTVYGWQLHPGADGPTTYRNFALQANGADMMRLAAIAITERGIRLCALIHDAVMIEAPLDDIERAVAETQNCMAAASRAVLDGFELGSEAHVIRWPDRFEEARGSGMWATVMDLLSGPLSIVRSERPVLSI